MLDCRAQRPVPTMAFAIDCEPKTVYALMQMCKGMCFVPAICEGLHRPVAFGTLRRNILVANKQSGVYA